MENNKAIIAPVTLKGTNYLLWSRTMKITLCSRGLWTHVLQSEASIEDLEGGSQGRELALELNKWFQEDQMVLSILQNSLESSLLEAYSYCENAKDLWETLKHVYGNTSNLMRIYEVKKALSDLQQEDMEFTKIFGKYRALWAELEMLRPNSMDPATINERREQDKVFGLLMVLNSNYTDLIKHLLREDKLPSLEEVCARVQREQGAQGLFGNKKELVSAHKVWHRPEEKKGWCDHCKRRGHTKEKCWLLHPHLKPNFPPSSSTNKWRDSRANVAQNLPFKGGFSPSSAYYDPSNGTQDNPGTQGRMPHTSTHAVNNYNNVMPGSSTNVNNNANFSHGAGTSKGSSYNAAVPTNIKGQSRSLEGEMQALATAQQEMVTKSDLEALFKALRESGITGHTFTASLNGSCYNTQIVKPLIVDSGASHHMISDSRLMNDIEPAIGNVMIANGERVPIRGIGNLKLFDKESKAFYMPTFTSNLLSVKKATTDLNCYAVFGPDEFFFQDIESQKVLGRGGTLDDLYVLEDLKPSSLVAASPLVVNRSSFSAFNNVLGLNEKDALWHARVGHPHSKALSLMFPSISFQNNACEACILGKHCRTVFLQSKTVYQHCFELVHSDVWTAPCESRENHKYFVTFIDEKSKYTWLTLLPSKDKVLEAFKNFHSYISNHYNVKLKCLRSDNGGEYTSHAFKAYLSQHGISHQTSCPYTPQQNGVAERKNRHLMDVARSLMFHMHVPKRFWSDAVVMACYLINRTPTRILADKSPFEVLNGTKPSLDHLRVFGCVCFVFVSGDHRTKLDAKSTRAVFIGYSPTQKGYKCYVPDTRKVLVSREVKFLETTSYFDNQKWEDIKDISTNPAANLRCLLERLGIPQFSTPSQPHSQCSPSRQPPAHNNPDPDPEGGPVDRHDHAQEDIQMAGDDYDSGGHNQVAGDGYESGGYNQETQNGQENQAQEDIQMTGDNQEHNTQMENHEVGLRRSKRLKFPPENWKKTRVYYNNIAVSHPAQAVCNLVHIPQEHQVFIGTLDQERVPKTYEEAKDHKVWKDAVNEEHQAMERNHTWDEATLPKGKRAVSSRWVFTIKYHSNGEIERYKARLVARGFTQTYGDDYRDTFAPVAKLHTIRVVLSLATNLDWELWQMDVKNAFLQGELEEEVYMTPPPGLENIVAKGKVLRLRKAIYGLKQSPRAWYHKLSMTLRDRGFRRSESDHTLFTLQGEKGIIVVLVYVDDIIISGNDKEGIQATKSYLKSVFDIKDLGKLKYFLGIEICRTNEGLFISQRKYVVDLLSDAGMMEAKAAKTPLEEGYKAEPQGEEEGAFGDPKLYRKIVGKLIYLTITRPDLCFSVNQVSQHMQQPKVHHWRMIERILRYLKGTYSQGVWMGANRNTEIVGYCDADWAGDRQDRRSTTGYCTFVGGNLVTWKTKKQKVVSCSSAEAEYRSMRKLTTECIWLKTLLQDLGVEVKAPITVHCDNQAAIHIATNSVFHERTKHIEVDCHKVREAVQNGIILPCFTRSEDQLADIFTKGASLKVCESIHPRLGLISIPST